MRVAVVGPLCKDVNVIGSSEYVQPGGVTYYAGRVLNSLGIDTIVFGSYKPNDTEVEIDLPFPYVPIKAEGTIEFKNIYPDKDNPDERVQEAKIYDNKLTFDSIKDDLESLDYIF